MNDSSLLHTSWKNNEVLHICHFNKKYLVILYYPLLFTGPDGFSTSSRGGKLMGVIYISNNISVRSLHQMETSRASPTECCRLCKWLPHPHCFNGFQQAMQRHHHKALSSSLSSFSSLSSSSSLTSCLLAMIYPEMTREGSNYHHVLCMWGRGMHSVCMSVKNIFLQ